MDRIEQIKQIIVKERERINLMKEFTAKTQDVLRSVAELLKDYTKDNPLMIEGEITISAWQVSLEDMRVEKIYVVDDAFNPFYKHIYLESLLKSF